MSFLLIPLYMTERILGKTMIAPLQTSLYILFTALCYNSVYKEKQIIC